MDQNRLQFDLIKKIAYTIWQKNWAEGSSGNLSMLIEKIPEKTEKPLYNFQLDRELPFLKDRMVLITISGSRMRELSDDDLALLFVEKREVYQFGGRNRASSEWRAHLFLHNYLQEVRSEERVVMHSHLPRMIALSHLFQNQEELSNKLLSVLHELTISFPTGIGLIDYLLTGSTELAEETVRKAKDFRMIVWKAHGVITFGKDLQSVYDQLEMIENAAFILLELLKIRPNGNFGLTRSELEEIKRL